MISVSLAKKLLLENIRPIVGKEQMLVADSAGYRLAETIASPLDLPPFNQSNVDGYALGPFSSDGWTLVGEIPAGTHPEMKLNEGEAVRIFTGASVPEGSHCVLMQEFADVRGNQVYLSGQAFPAKDSQIRLKGSHIHKGDTSLHAGTIISHAAISLLHSMGLDKILVFKKPVIVLVVTGSELQFQGSVLQPAKSYESNAAALTAAAKSMQLETNVLFVSDDKEELKKALGKGLTADVLLVCGGISVGDYDYVKECLLELNTGCVFHGIAQKPGKPLFFGKRKNTLVFGLPGNPASALTCFYEYVYPAMGLLRGRKSVFLESRNARLKKDVKKKKGMTHYLKAYWDGSEVEALEGQDSYIMKSFAGSNAFIYLPEEAEEVKAGMEVEIHLLPEY